MATSTVLIVEDDPDIRETLTDILAEEGFDVKAVMNGEEAMEHLRKCERIPDLILTDLMMPLMTGWELLRSLKQEQRFADIPVFVTSAVGDAQLPQGVPVLKKPLSFDTLMQAIHERFHPVSRPSTVVEGSLRETRFTPVNRQAVDISETMSFPAGQPPAATGQGASSLHEPAAKLQNDEPDRS